MLKHRRIATPTKDTGVNLANSRAPDSPTKRCSSVPPKLDKTMVLENSEPSAVGEQSLISIRASVVIYDDTYKKWLPCGQLPSGISKIHIYHNTADKTYRIVGRKIQDKELTINVKIQPSTRYSEATPTFHQIRDNRRKIHGINFSTRDEAVAFSKTVNAVLHISQQNSNDSQKSSRKTSVDERNAADIPRSHSANIMSAFNTPSSDQPFVTLKTNGTAVTSSPSPTLSNHKYNAWETWLKNATVSYDRQTLPVTSHPVESSSYPQPVMSPTPLPYSHYTSYSTVATPAAVYSNPRHVHRQPSQADSYASVPVSYGSVTNGSTPASEQHTLVNNFAVNKDAYKHLPVRSIERSASIGGDQNGLSNELPAAIFNIANSVKGSSTSSLDSPTTEQVKLPSVPSPPPPPPPPAIPEGGIPQPFRPVPSSAGSSAAPLSGLAAALKSATLKSVSSKVETSNIPAPMVTAKAGLMEEMQRKLARRKAKADGEDMTSVSSGSSRSSPFQAVPHTTVSTSNQHVLKPSYQQSSLPNNSQLNKKAAAESLPHQLEQLKQELMVEIKDDLEKLRQDIILAIEENK